MKKFYSPLLSASCLRISCVAFYTFLVLFFISPRKINAQDTPKNFPENPNKIDEKGLKQGKWTIFFDKKGNLINATQNPDFYRIVTYKDNKPIELVKTYRKNGTLLMQGYLKADQPQEIKEGITSWFDENGIKQTDRLYINGEIRGEKGLNDKGVEVYNTTIAQKEVPLTIENVKAKKYEEAIVIMEFHEKGILNELKDNISGKLNYYQNLLECYENIKDKDIFKNIIAKQLEQKEEKLKEIKNIIVALEKSKPQDWQTFYRDGLSDYYAGNNNKAIAKLKKALTLIIEKEGKNTKTYSKIINTLSIVNTAQGNYKNGYDLANEARNLDEKLYGKDSVNYGLACTNLAHVATKLNKFAEAEKLYEEGKNIVTKTLGKENDSYATICSNFSLFYYEQGVYKKAMALALESKNIRERVLGKNHLYYAESCNNLAAVYEANANITKAKQYYEETKSIYEKQLGKNHPLYATICNNLARFYDNQNAYYQATNLYLESLEILEKKLGKEHPNYATTCNNLAFVYKKRKIFDKSESLFLEAKNSYEKIFGKINRHYALACANLSDLYTTQGLYEKAEPLFLENMKILEQMITRDFWHLSENEKAQYYQNLSARFDDYMNFSLKYYLKKPEFLGEVYNTLLFTKALLFHSSNKVKQKILNGKDENLKKMFEKWQNDKEILVKNYALTTQERIAQNIDLTKQEEEVNILEKQLSSQSQLFTSAQDRKKYIWKDVQKALKKDEVAIEIKHITQEKETPIFDFMGKGFSVIGQENDFAIIENISPFSPAQKAGLQIFDKILEINGNSTKGKSNQELIKMTENNSYTIKYFSFLQNKEISCTLKTDSVFKTQKTLETKYVALLLTATSQYPEIIVLDNPEKMSKEYLAYYRNLAIQKVEDEESYKHYWSKIKKSIPANTKKVFISLDGVYNIISIASLYNPENQKYLMDEIDLQILSNTKELVSRKNNNKPLKNATLIGFPDYNNTHKTEIKNLTEIEIKKQAEAQKTLNKNLKDAKVRWFNGENENITALEGTKTEIANLEKILKTQKIDIKVLLDKYSTEENIKKLSSPQILHIATHGFFLADITNENNAEKMLGLDSKKVLENPLLRAGLLFANAKNALKNGGDGVLTAYETMNLDLDDTELVVMSACETGLGEVKNGEGVYGLQRAFQTAGAKTVLMSLWTVSDDATQSLMTLFYENWITKKQSKREAFKNAQIALRLKFPEPYFWGAFVMVGE